jgi:hypothetical protein
MGWRVDSAGPRPVSSRRTDGRVLQVLLVSMLYLVHGAAHTAAAQDVPVAFRTFQDLQATFPGQVLEPISRTREGALAAVRLRVPGGRPQVFVLAGFEGYRDAWRRGVELSEIPAKYQVDHLYPENSALGASKKGFRARLTAWRAHLQGARPAPRNYEWLRVEAIHQDVNGQVGRIWEQRTARLRDRTRVDAVRRAGPFELMKLDGAWGQPESQMRLPVKNGKDIRIVSLPAYEAIRAAKVAKAAKTVVASLPVVGAGLEMAIVADAIDRFRNSSVYRMTAALLEDEKYEEARSFWLRHCAVEDDRLRHQDCFRFQLALAEVSGQMGIRTFSDFPAAMRGWYALMEEDARAEVDELIAAGATMLVEDEPLPAGSPPPPPFVEFASVTADDELLFNLLAGGSQHLVGSEVALGAVLQTAFRGHWVPVRNAPVIVSISGAEVARSMTDRDGRAALTVRAPASYGQHVYVSTVGELASDSTTVWTYDYVIRESEYYGRAADRPARADDRDPVVVRLNLNRRISFGAGDRFLPPSVGEDVAAVLVLEAADAEVPHRRTRIGSHAANRAERGMGFRPPVQADGAIVLDIVANLPGTRTLEVYAERGRYGDMHQGLTKLGAFQVRFEETMPGLALEWAGMTAAQVDGSHAILTVPRRHTDLTELRVRALTRRSGAPEPVDNVRIRMDARPANGLRTYRGFDVSTGADGMALASDGTWPSIYGVDADTVHVTLTAEGSANDLTLSLVAIPAESRVEFGVSLEPVFAVMDIIEGDSAVVRGQIIRNGLGSALDDSHNLIIEGTNGVNLQAPSPFQVRPAYWGSGNDQSRYLELRPAWDGTFEFTVRPRRESYSARLTARVWDAGASRFVADATAELRWVERSGIPVLVSEGQFTRVHRHGHAISAAVIPSPDGRVIENHVGRLHIIALDAAGKPLGARMSVRRTGSDAEVTYSYGAAVDVSPGDYTVVIQAAVPITRSVRVSAGRLATVHVAGLGRLEFDHRDALGLPHGGRISIRSPETGRELTYSYGTAVDLPQGSYDVVFSYTPPITHDGVDVRAYHTTTVSASGYGRLAFQAFDALGIAINPRISIRRDGVDEQEVTYSYGTPVDVPPGAYSVVFAYTPPIVLPAQVSAGAVTSLRAGGYGRLDIEVVRRGQRVQQRVSIRRAGERDEVAYTYGGTVDLAPGAYELVLRLGDGSDERVRVVVQAGVIRRARLTVPN